MRLCHESFTRASRIQASCGKVTSERDHTYLAISRGNSSELSSIWPGLALTWPWPHHNTCNGWTAYSQILPVYHLQPIYDPLFSLVLAWAYDRCFRLSPEHLWWCSALKLENHLKIYQVLAYVQTLRHLTPNLICGHQCLTPACFSKIVLSTF